MLYIMARSIEQGKKAGIISVLGVSLGGSVHVLAGAIGVSAILMTSATAFNFVKYLGAVFLIYRVQDFIFNIQSNDFSNSNSPS